MLHGAVLRPPAPEAVLRTVDCGPAEAMPGVTVVRDGDFIGVTAADSADRAASRRRDQGRLGRARARPRGPGRIPAFSSGRGAGLAASRLLRSRRHRGRAGRRRDAGPGHVHDRLPRARPAGDQGGPRRMGRRAADRLDGHQRPVRRPRPAQPDVRDKRGRGARDRPAGRRRVRRQARRRGGRGRAPRSRYRSAGEGALEPGRGVPARLPAADGGDRRAGRAGYETARHRVGLLQGTKRRRQRVCLPVRGAQPPPALPAGRFPRMRKARTVRSPRPQTPSRASRTSTSWRTSRALTRCASVCATSMTSVCSPWSRRPSGGSGRGPAGGPRDGQPGGTGCWVWRGAGMAVGLEKVGRVATCAEVVRRRDRSCAASPGE